MHFFLSSASIRKELSDRQEAHPLGLVFFETDLAYQDQESRTQRNELLCCYSQQILVWRFPFIAGFVVNLRSFLRLFPISILLVALALCRGFLSVVPSRFRALL